jgi:NADH-quinone oxidoreductase subunit N
LSSEDLLIFFLAFEIQSLGFYVLTGLKRYSNSSVTAALNYFFYGALFSCFFLLAITLLYFFTGSTSLFEIHSLLISLPSNDSFSAVLVICIWFSIFVVFFKLAVFPFHF